MESKQESNSLPQRDIDFRSLVIDIIGDVPQVPEEESAINAGIFARMWRATKRFFSSAVSLGKAFAVSAATGQPATLTELSPEGLRLKQEMKELLEQLHWLEAGEVVVDPDDIASAPQRLWAAETLAIAVRLKILQRAANYCRLKGESPEQGDHLRQVLSMHRYYLRQFSMLQGKQRSLPADMDIRKSA